MSGAGRIGLLLWIAGVTSTGCWFHGPGDLKRDLSREAGVRLDTKVGITVGPTSLMFAKLGLKMADEPELSLKGVRKVQVGVYRVEGTRAKVEDPRPITADLFVDWEPLVKVHEAGGDVLVLLRQRDDRIRGLLVVVAEEDEWVLVRVKGRLDRILEDTIRMAFDEVDRPDLYARSRRERGLDPTGDGGPAPPVAVEDDGSSASLLAEAE